ncbi:MAG: chemotaxis protein CheD [Magnetococcales bacterium]|nr:chemotaxis protein CheD [Magnetococcales bacterium]
MTTGSDPSKPFLMPGALFAQNGVYVITTVLGSCIAVCLWDRMRKEGGMNHYKLPLWNGDGLPSPKYGNIAIAKLIERMDEMGCLRRNIVAKVFGGGAVIKSTSGLLNVGERNIEVAVDYLARENIPIVASDMGGDYSRKIIFNTEEGTIMMKKAAPS